jgi:hypothetical protein
VAGGSSAKTHAGAPATTAYTVTNDSSLDHECREEPERTIRQL